MFAQPAVLAEVPPHAAFLFLDLRHGAAAREALAELTAHPHAEHLLVGLGLPLLHRVGAVVPGLAPMPHWPDAPVNLPNTPCDLLLRVSGADPGEVLHRERALLAALPSFQVVDQVQCFKVGVGLDLSGYVDGTENPTGDDAATVALSADPRPGLNGSSVVAVQRWLHDLTHWDGLDRTAQDHHIGRDRDTNEELPDAPHSAHVKRTAQEDFAPPAFLSRRSMPWRDHRGAGLVFVSFSATLDPFEAQLRRMCGVDDGVVDALFSFTRPLTGSAWWCPPVHDGRLDLRAL